MAGDERTLLRLFGAVGEGWSSNRASPLNTHGNWLWHHLIGENVWIDNLGQVTIGNHCCLSQGALLLCGNHNYKKATFDLMVGDITLEDGVWIGARSSVGPGVICGSHSVLAMGSTALKDLDAWMVHQGNPACAKSQRNT